MSEVTDDDFLAALESDPWLYAAATQSPTQSQSQPLSSSSSSSITQQPKPTVSQHGEEPLTLTAVIAAQGRRRNIIARIESALERWKPTLTDTFPPEADTSTPQTPNGECDDSDNTKDDDNSDPSTEIRTSKYFRPSSVMKQRELLARWMSLRQNDENPNLGPDGNELDKYQLKVVNAARAGESFFLTGSAGTGKSYVLQTIIRQLQNQGRIVAVTASTGCAAVGIHGCTIHSFAGVGLGLETKAELVRKAGTDRRIRERFWHLDTLIIDEISMIDSFLFDKIEAVACAARTPITARRRKEDENSPKREERWEEPFGGLQVIVCGDFFQLPPVGASDRRYQNSRQKYFVFDSQAWKSTIKQTFVLQLVHRQGDRTFVGLLNEIRQGVVSNWTKEVLGCCRIEAQQNVEVDDEGKVVHFTKLFAYRRQVAMENTTQLMKLKVQGVRFVCKDFVDRAAMGTLTERIVEQMLTNTNAPDSIELRKGARVLCVKNLDQKNGIVNGTSGVVIGWSHSLTRIFQQRKAVAEKAGLKDAVMVPTAYDLSDEDIFDIDSEKLGQTLKSYGVIRPQKDALVLQQGTLGLIAPVVRFDNGIVRLMQPEAWEVHGLKGQVVGIRTQVPLMLGWALSIHRSQGMTLGEVETDVGRAFDYGQVYVALSRATSVQGLRLRSFDGCKVIAHEKVAQFYRTISKGIDLRNSAAAQSRQV